MINLKNKLKELFEREEAPQNFNPEVSEEATIPTTAIVEQIHNEFFSASELIIKEANQIINSISKASNEKGIRLEKLGFTAAPETIEVQKKIRAEAIAQKARENAVYFSQTYPHYKYIDEAAIERVCEKYNLVFGEVSMYKGFVPEKNLQEIENFKIKEEDEFNGIFVRSSFSSAPYWVEYTKIRDENIDSDGHVSFNRSIGTRTIKDSQKIKTNKTLYICAPIKDMETHGSRVVGHKIYPDPIVLRMVRGGGYLIMTAWGDEASDPEVSNPKMN